MTHSLSKKNAIKNLGQQEKVKFNRQHGMTLMELMFALTLATVVMVAASGLAGLIAKTTGQLKVRGAQFDASQRVLGLVDAEFRELVQIVQVGNHDILYDTSFSLGAGVKSGRSALRCVVDPGSGLMNLVHLSIVFDGTAPIARIGGTSAPAEVQRTLYSHLTDCKVEVGLRVTQANGQSGSIHWAEVGKDMAIQGEAWLRVRFANAQGVQIPLWLGKVSSSA